MWAAAAMSLFAETLIGIIAAVFVIRHTQWKPDLRMFAKCLGASLVMAFGLYALRDASALISVPIGTILYITALAALGGPSPKSLLRLFRPDPGIVV